MSRTREAQINLIRATVEREMQGVDPADRAVVDAIVDYSIEAASDHVNRLEAAHAAAQKRLRRKKTAVRAVGGVFSFGLFNAVDAFVGALNDGEGITDMMLDD